MALKGRVRENFSKGAQSYDTHSDIQDYCAKKLLNLICENEFFNILDIGCGTGTYTKLLAHNFPKARVKAMDLSEEMVDIAKRKLEGARVDVFQADAEELSIKEEFDLITSNAAFQWFSNLEKSIERYSKLLSGNGIMLFSIFGPKTFLELDLVSKTFFGKDFSVESKGFCEKDSLSRIISKHLKSYTIEELIYEKGWRPQEVEFTFESPFKKDLYLLQGRDMAMRERKRVFTFDLDGKTEESFLGHGIGVSGGAMSGRIIFSLQEIDKWRTAEPDTSLILVRGDTVPDDIREIYAADGLLTARGGVTSHAAVVAHRLGKTCVVGCGNLICNETAKNCKFNQVLFKSGDHLSIDGREGSVYQGLIRINPG